MLSSGTEWCRMVPRDTLVGTLSSQDGNAKEDFD